VTDSIYPLHDKHAVFRIELEYGEVEVGQTRLGERRELFDSLPQVGDAVVRVQVDKVFYSDFLTRE
jgi:hypothetical protein